MRLPALSPRFCSWLIVLVLLAGAGCSGPAPEAFTPFEPRDTTLAALSLREGELSFLVVGDWGRRGRYFQDEVAEQMGRVAALVDSRFVATTGDNFYPVGVQSVYDDHWDDSFGDVYTHPALQTPWHPTFGNHDYHGSIWAQVSYSDRSDRWSMPAPYYAFETTIDDTTRAHFIFLDTTPLYLLDQGDAAARAQLAWLDATLAGSTADWKIVVGHHPLYSAGRHDFLEPIRRRLEPRFEEFGVHAYIAGHDHNLQHFHAEGIDYYVSGGGSRLYSIYTREHPFLRFAVSRPGFLVVRLSAGAMRTQFVDHRGNVLYGTLRLRPAALRPSPPPSDEG